MRSTALDTIVALAAGLSALTALWLLSVIATVLPARDPGSVPGWTLFAAALLGFASLTVMRLRGWSRVGARRWSVVASVVAVIVGTYVLVTAVSRTTDFEGYLVVIGAVVLLHGAAMLARERTQTPLAGSAPLRSP